MNTKKTIGAVLILYGVYHTLFSPWPGSGQSTLDLLSRGYTDAAAWKSIISSDPGTAAFDVALIGAGIYLYTK